MDQGEIESGLIAIGWRVRAARERRGWTPEQLAERMGVSRVSVVGWEGQQSGRYSVATAMRLASVLGVKIGWLLSGQGARDAKAVKP